MGRNLLKYSANYIGRCPPSGNRDNTMNPYLQIARPDHWIKNLFAVPGVILAFSLLKLSPLRLGFWLDFLLGMAALCAAASANYVINEWLDADFDRLHPEKKQRVCCTEGRVKKGGVYLEYGLLMAASLGLGFWVSLPAGLMIALLLGQGVVYNIPPLRLKDVTILDVVAESVNNPIRLLLGWFLVTADYLPPSSLIAGYWAAGAFLMTTKRYTEYCSLKDPALAARYRASFKGYNKERLLTLSFFYGISASFFLGVFMIKNRIELLLSIPFVAVLFAWYFHLGHRPGSAAEHPEKLHKEKAFMAYFAFVALLFALLLVVDVPRLSYFLEFQYMK